jgi:hypothetical protein
MSNREEAMVDNYAIPQKYNANTQRYNGTGIRPAAGTGEIFIEQYEDAQGVTMEITIQSAGSLAISIYYSPTVINIVNYNPY